MADRRAQKTEEESIGKLMDHFWVMNKSKISKAASAINKQDLKSLDQIATSLSTSKLVTTIENKIGKLSGDIDSFAKTVAERAGVNSKMIFGLILVIGGAMIFKSAVIIALILIIAGILKIGEGLLDINSKNLDTISETFGNISS